MSTDSTEIKEYIVQFYNQLYFEQFTWQPNADGLSLLSIDAEKSNWLERDLEQEVWEVVRDLNGDKVLGLSGLGLRNGLELVLILEEEPSPLSCCPIDKVRGFSGKKSVGGFLKAVLEYNHSVGITCDGYEGPLSAVFKAIIASNDKKEAGHSSILGIKGTRELRLSLPLIMTRIVAAPLVVCANGGRMEVYYEAPNSFVEY